MFDRRQCTNRFPRYKMNPPVCRIRNPSPNTSSNNRSSGLKPIFTGKEIGRGAYGRVVEVDCAGTLCAAKQVHPKLFRVQNFTASELGKINKNFKKGCNIWRTLRDSHIVQLLKVYRCYDDSPLPTIIMEKLPLSLTNLVETYSRISLNVKASILNDVALGLKYLHSCNPPIVHGDITPNNILLGNNLEAKITDIGVAKVLQCDAKLMMTQAPGTVFMPPESLDDCPHYGLPLDVFSYGAVSLYMITQLWPELRPCVIIRNDETVRLSEVQRRQYYTERINADAEELRPLIESCLDDDPNRRPTIAEVSEIIGTYTLKTHQVTVTP